MTKGGSLLDGKPGSVPGGNQHQKTYLPVNPAAVELADEARKRGRRRILENKAGANVETFRPGELKLNTKGDAK